jgi:protein gp37
MSAKTTIEWTSTTNPDGSTTPGATWSPLRARVRPDAKEIASQKGYTSLLPILDRIASGKVGHHCEHVSPGCEHCYSETNNARCLPHNGTGLPFDRRSRDLVEMFLDEEMLTQPLRWKRGRKIFVESQSDLFGEFVPDELIDRVFAVMALCSQHTFQVLTKRAERMRNWAGELLVDSYYSDDSTPVRIMAQMNALANVGAVALKWPLPNVWLGVSCEDQQRADERIEHLTQTPAAVRFASYEPALGPVDFSLDRWVRLPRAVRSDLPWELALPVRAAMPGVYRADSNPHGALSVRTGSGLLGIKPGEFERLPKLDWIIVGGESGPGARPMNPQWARDVRDQCAAAGVPFFFKQWGAWVSVSEVEGKGRHFTFEDGRTVRRLGAKAAGRSLDGRTWDEFPEMSR